MQRIYNLESLRGLLVLWVVIFHIGILSGFMPENATGLLRFFADGTQAVNVFVILSGFVIFLLLDVRQESYPTFIYRRFLRVFPAYSICLLVFLPLIQFFWTSVKALPWHTEAIAGELDAFSSAVNHFIPHLLAHLTLLHGALGSVLPASAFTFLGPAWSLSLEWQFYLIAPLVISVVRLGNAMTILSLMLLSMLAYWVFQGGEHMGFLPQAIPLFILGILSFYVWKDKSQTQWYTHSRLLLFLFAVFAYLQISKIAMVIWFGVFAMSYLDKNILDNPVLTYLGKISYSVYISHMMVLYFGVYILNSLHITNQQQFFWGLVLLALPVTLGLSHLLYHYVEKPCIEFGKRGFSLKVSPS